MNNNIAVYNDRKFQLNITIQRGSCYDINSKLIKNCLEQHDKTVGKVVHVEYDGERGTGFVEFESEEDFKNIVYKNVKVDTCNIFMWKELDMIGENPEPGIVLIESPLLPCGFDKLSVVRSHFEKFCQINGIVFLPTKSGVRRAFVSFPSDMIAKSLHGAMQKVGKGLVDLKEMKISNLK